MGNQDLSFMEAYGRFKTMRRKKRLQKKDKEKKLIQLAIRRTALFERKRSLPLIPLECPYQRGWKRSFILREDVQRSEDSEFFQTILNKINTINYSHHKHFSRKKRINGKRVLVVKPQFLNEISFQDWKTNKILLTEKERSFFSEKETWVNTRKEYTVVYTFDQPWRFILKIKPNMITHTKTLDIELESEIREIQNYLVKNNLFHKMIKLTRNRRQAWKSCLKEKEKYQFSFHHKQYNEYWERIELN